MALPLGPFHCRVDTCQWAKVAGDRVGQNGQGAGGKAVKIAVGIQRQWGALARRAVDNVVEQASPPEHRQGFVPATHTTGPAPRKDDAGDRGKGRGCGRRHGTCLPRNAGFRNGCKRLRAWVGSGRSCRGDGWDYGRRDPGQAGQRPDGRILRQVNLARQVLQEMAPLKPVHDWTLDLGQVQFDPHVL